MKITVTTDAEGEMIEPLKDSYDAVIIGAGLSGISAGIRLAQFFDDVLIVETHNAPGGLNSYYHAGDPRQLFSSGLHTVTNANVSGRKWGLRLIARNLGIDPQAFEIYKPRCASRITTPDCSVRFSNDPQLLAEEIATAFPAHIDEFRRVEEQLVRKTTDPAASSESAMQFLRASISSRQLADLIALPVFTYAGYAEDDIDLRTFAVLYRSIFVDGCGSPVDMKQFLERLIGVFEENGGELCYRCRVKEITHADGTVTGVRLKDGREIRATYLLSSAGLYETGQLAGIDVGRPGRISLFQMAACYDRQLSELGVDDSVHFMSRAAPLQWRFRQPQDALRVITFSAQDSYEFAASKHQLKVSCFDNYDHWTSLKRVDYKRRKADRVEALMAIALETYPGLREGVPFYTDSFSPSTIKRFTSHPNGTLYGGAIKAFDGSTGIENLIIIGNDQGGIGIMGALTSGILMANYRILTRQ